MSHVSTSIEERDDDIRMMIVIMMTTPVSRHVRNKIAFQSKADHPQTGYTDTIFSSCDLDFDPMTLKDESDIKILQ